MSPRPEDDEPGTVPNLATDTLVGGLSPDQLRTAEILDRILGTAFSERYRDFCLLASGTLALRVSIPLAAHALREIESLLRETLEGPLGVKIEIDDAERQRIARAVKALGEIGFDQGTVGRAAKALQPSGHKAQILRLMRRLGFADDSLTAKAWRKLIDSQYKATHRRSFRKSLAVDDDFRAEFQQPFDLVLHEVALALERKYDALMGRVEALAKFVDKGDAIARFVEEIPNAEPLQLHFYDSISGPEWLQLLIDKGLVAESPSMIDPSDIGYRWRAWAPGLYLSRIAQGNDVAAQRLVARSILSLQGASDPALREQCLEILTKLPAEEAAPVAPLVVDWLTRQNAPSGTHHPIELIKRLTAVGYGEEALAIARAAFDFDVDHREFSRENRDTMRDHYLREVAPGLARACGVRVLPWLCELVVEAGTRADLMRSDLDYSASTGFALDRQVAPDFYRATISVTVRTAAQLITDHPASTASVIGEFERHKWKILRRILLYTLSFSSDEAALPIALRYLTDREVVGEHAYEAEYALLAKSWFPKAPADRQTEILGVIEAHPTQYLDTFRSWFEATHNRPPDSSDEQEFVELEVCDAVRGWSDVLPPEWQRRVTEANKRRISPRELIARLNTPDQSPLSVEAMTSMTPSEVAAFLESWRPEPEPKKVTISALAQALSQAIEKRPKIYAEKADAFTSLGPLFVRRVLETLHNIASRDIPFEWPAMLTLIERAVRQVGNPVPADRVAEGDDESWDFAAISAVHLLRNGLRQGTGRIPPGLEPQVRSVVDDLAARVAPPPEDAVLPEHFDDDPYAAAHGTLWGLRIEASISFLSWRSRFDPSDAGPGSIRRNPSIAACLSAGGNQAAPGVRIARAILGRHLHALVGIDPEWTVGALAQIMAPKAGGGRVDADGWLSFITHNDSPVPELLAGLQPLYAQAIELLGDTSEDAVARFDDHRRETVVRHIIRLYVWGYLEPGTGDLLDHFLRATPGKLRGNAMYVIGHYLAKHEPPFDTKYVERAKAYCGARLAAAAKLASPPQLELGCIAWWCGTPPSEPDWLYDQVVQKHKLGVKPMRGSHVMEWLDELANTSPERAVAAARLLVGVSADDLFLLHTWRSNLKSLLMKARACSSETAKEHARETISILASRNLRDFVRLL